LALVIEVDHLGVIHTVPGSEVVVVVGLHCGTRLSGFRKRSSPFFRSKSDFDGPHHLVVTVQQDGIQRALGLVAPDGIVDTVSDLFQHLPNGVGLAVGILVSDLGGGGGVELNRDFHRADSMTAFRKRSRAFAKIFERFFASGLFQNRMPHRP
tara:strand:+ start:128 stop:586 length:459 start_codon:yes stop_codon:yes gene_type:complete